PADLVSSRLSASSREFLTSVGLPTITVQEIEPIAHERLAESTFLHGREYVVVAESYDRTTRYGIDVRSDEVWYLDTDPSNTCLFNSSIALFVLFLGIYQRSVLELEVTDQDTLENAVAGVWSQLEARDPAATDPGNYWEPILDQVVSEYE
ncbi:SUKH-4 family immunity protein, partial [Kibdelosporangium lantanae]